MKYADARSLIRSGDLLAWSHRSWATWYDMQVMAVRTFTQSEYCHTGIAWVIGGRVFVIEAVTPKVRIYPLSKLLPFWLVRMDAPWGKDAEEFALSQVGADYSKWQAVQAYFGRPPRDELWECAELSRAILDADGIFLDCKDVPSDLVYAAQRHAGERGTILIEA